MIFNTNCQTFAKRCATTLCVVVGYVLLVTTAQTSVANPTQDAFFDLTLQELTQVQITSVSLFESDALTVGSTVKVMERADWQHGGTRGMLSSFAHQPGTMLLPSIFGLNVIAIRGYAQIGSARGIATVLDGIPLNGINFGTAQYTAQNIGLGVLDRIEVVRGPGSALYGSDAFHGVVAMSAFESGRDLTRLSIAAGIDHYYQTGLQHSVGFDNGLRVNLALAASAEQRDSRYQGLDLNTGSLAEFNPEESFRSQTGSLKMQFKPTADLEIKWGFYLDHFNTDDYPGTLKIIDDSSRDSTIKASQISANQQFSRGRSLEARLYHVNSRSAGSAFNSSGIKDTYTNSTTEESRSGAVFTFRQPVIERLNTRLAIGFGYEQAKFDHGKIERIALDETLTPQRFDFPGQGEKQEIAHLLLEGRTVLPAEQWSINYGGRLDHYSDMGTQLTPRLGLIFKPTEDSAFKLLYNQAFRAPTIAERFSTTPTGQLDLDAEILDSYELVFLKQRDRWSAEIVVFENRWKNGIIIVPAPGPIGITYKNQNRNKAQGIEGSLIWLSGPWRFDVSGSYVRSRNLITGQDYKLFPRTMATIGVSRQLPALDAEISVNNQLFDQAKDITLIGALSTPDDLPFYWRTDLSFTKRLSRQFELSVNVINLFNRDNRLPSVLGFPGGVPDRPLSVNVNLGYEW